MSVDVPGITDAVSIVANDAAACVVRATGKVSCWGNNTSGQLGDGTTTSSRVPVDVLYVSDAASVSMGQLVSCAVRRTGAVVCWGYPGRGGFGNNFGAQGTPVLNVGDAVRAVSGYTTNCAQRSGGTVTCWGNPFQGESGDNATGPEPAPVASVYQLTGVSFVSMVYAHACAVGTAGAPFLSCWGNGNDGQLGTGTMGPAFEAAVPVPVIGFN
jgi:alpha-tubulin suppressor-like RCC1 family protein